MLSRIVGVWGPLGMSSILTAKDVALAAFDPISWIELAVILLGALLTFFAKKKTDQK